MLSEAEELHDRRRGKDENNAPRCGSNGIVGDVGASALLHVVPFLVR